MPHHGAEGEPAKVTQGVVLRGYSLGNSYAEQYPIGAQESARFLLDSNRDKTMSVDSDRPKIVIRGDRRKVLQAMLIQTMVLVLSLLLGQPAQPTQGDKDKPGPTGTSGGNPLPKPPVTVSAPGT